MREEPADGLAPARVGSVAGLIDRGLIRAADRDVIHLTVGPTGVPRTGEVRDHERKAES